MKAIAVFPREANSIHLAEHPMPRIDEIPNGRGVLVKVLRVGLDGTDREICKGEYGIAPAGSDFLIIGHENFGQVIEAGPNVGNVKSGDYVVATVRRPGTSIYDKIGMSDLTTDDVYLERGINLLHGFLAEYYVDDAEYIVRVPDTIKNTAVLMEPFTVAQKGLSHAYEIQRRLRVWRPRRAAVMGAGSIGLLATLALRLSGLDVWTFALPAKPNRNAELVEDIGARCESVEEMPILDGAKKYGPFDIIFEATGYSPIVFDCMRALGKNGVLVLSSITGGNREIRIASDRINLEFVLGNKVMVGTVNANSDHFAMAAHDLVLAEGAYPGWLARLVTDPIKGLENYRELMNTLNRRNAIKVVCEVAPY